MAGLPPSTVPPRVLAKGTYFSLSGPSPFKRLIYPMPEPGGLGVHVTLDLGGQAKFGPDIEWVDEVTRGWGGCFEGGGGGLGGV
jgi:L-2-hydroxyglutarate oxidase LhgO